jgi:proteic killer suppression protein
MLHYQIVIARLAQKQLKKIPAAIVFKLQAWVDGILASGLAEIRKIPGFHDEPLKGKRRGQRSIRLSKAYRAIYRVEEKGKMEIIEILEVNKHDY